MTALHDGSGDPNSRLRQLLDDSLREQPADHDMDAVLRGVVEAAAEILDCEYAAISVLGPGRRTEYFVPFGVDPAAAERIGRLPQGHGLLGVIVDNAETVRIQDARTDPRAIELPPEHPDIRALLGVPIMLRGRPAGGLYLSKPRGRDAFAADDEPVAQLIATAAANVIEKARTATENARRDRWLTGAADISRELAAGTHENPLVHLAETLLGIADADLVSVVQPGPTDETVVVSAAVGRHADQWDGYILPIAESLVADVMSTGKPIAVPHLRDSVLPQSFREMVDLDAMLILPLNGTKSSRSVLTIGRAEGRRPFTSGELGMATMFAGQVALALELAELQSRRDQVAIVEERDRIARDLHDHVIQRLFAIGLTMQSASMHATGRPAQQLRTSVDDIDETIKQIRSTIYRLTVPIVSPQASLRAQTGRMLDDLELALGFRPTLDIEGPIDFGIGDDVVSDCVAVLREALTNVAKHAEATRATVSIRVTSSSITLDVRDNGRGIGDVSRRSGLSNMRVRAERRDGSLTVRSDGEQGTRLIWSVPLDDVVDDVVDGVVRTVD